MKRVTRNGVIAAACGAVAMTAPVSAAFAADGGATADGAAVGSPGLVSGNTIQLPVHIPVNVCGNTVSVVGLLNPAAGNRCANASAGRDRTPAGGAVTAQGGAMTAQGGGATARGGGKDSPGVVSGNDIQLPVHVPVNVSGNTANVVGIGNPAVGNTSINTSVDRPAPPAPQPVAPPARSKPKPDPAPKPLPRPVTAPVASLAHTGADQTMPAVAASAALLLGGAVLYRRHRPSATR